MFKIPSELWPKDMRPKPHEINGSKPGRFVKLQHKCGAFIWVMLIGKDGNSFCGRVESTFPGGPSRGDLVPFKRSEIFELL